MTIIVNYTAPRVPIFSNPPPVPSELEVRLVDALEHGRLALPVLPEVAEAALTLAGNSEASITELVYLVQKDPPMAARFLSNANSTYYARGQQITRLDQAIMRIGLMGSRDLLFQIVYGNNAVGLRRFRDAVTRGFERSVRCAMAARSVSEALDLELRDAYLCGLLHDIGESRVYRILERALPKDQAADEAEISDLVARYHQRAGAEIAQEWKLPEEIRGVCEQHHGPPRPAVPHLRVVQVADVLVDALPAEAELNAEALDRLAVPIEIGERLLGELRAATSAG